MDASLWLRVRKKVFWVSLHFYKLESRLYFGKKSNVDAKIKNLVDWLENKMCINVYHLYGVEQAI